jgi:flagellar hook-associated protein 1 FlgK
MADIFSIGLSGIRASQNGLSVTGNNIANAQDVNYTRREVIFSEGAASLLGGGVEIQDVRRIFDQGAQSNLLSAIQKFSLSEEQLQQLQLLEQRVNPEGSGLGEIINQVFTSLQQVNSDPGSIQTRQLLMDKIQVMVDRFNDVSQQISDNFDQLNTQLDNIAQKVNEIASRIADLNVGLSKPDDGSHNALLDERDKLLRELSQYMSFNTFIEGNGVMNISVGSGTPLVLGTRASTLTTVRNAENPLVNDVVIQSGSTTANMTSFINQGQMGGIINYRENILQTTQNALNRLALAVADSYNTQNQLGMDLNNNLGGNIFKDINSASVTGGRVLPNSNNTGTGALNVTIDNVSQLTTSEYRLTFSSPSNYSLIRNSDNTTVASGALGALPDTISADGFTINVTAGALAAGDLFLISPTRNAASNIGLEISSPAQLALASPVKAESSTANIGDASIALTSVTDTSNAIFATPGQLTPPLRVEFLSTTTYQIVNATTSATIEGPIAYNPNASNSVFPTPLTYDPGFRVNISGNAQAGDTFNITYNNNAVGDNRNGLLFSQIHENPILESNFTLSEGFNKLVNDVALKVNSSQVAFDASEAVKQQAEAVRDSISGVSLEEEAVNLVRFEKAFQANAEVLATANRMFDTLLALLTG